MNIHSNPFRSIAKNAKLIAAPALLLALAACGESTADTVDLTQAPLAGAAIGGDFALTEETGKAARFSDYEGQYRMIYFGYAYCPDVCPFDTQRMAKGYEDFKKENPQLAAKVTPMFVTVDHERDTPDVVAEFTDAFSPDLVGFTGSEEQIADAAEMFGVFYSKGEESQPGAYLMDHSRSAFLMAPDGSPIALLPVEDSAEGVTQVLEAWVR